MDVYILFILATIKVKCLCKIFKNAKAGSVRHVSCNRHEHIYYCLNNDAAHARCALSPNEKLEERWRADTIHIDCGNKQIAVYFFRSTIKRWYGLIG